MDGLMPYKSSSFSWNSVQIRTSGGINDCTPLHMAVGERNLPAIQLLLEAGADPRLRTQIDDYETPRETAVRAGFLEAANLLEAYETGKL